MSDEPTGSGNLPEGTPPPAPTPEGAARFADFSVDKQGNVLMGGEIVSREFAAPEKVEPSDEDSIKLGDKTLSRKELADLLSERESLAERARAIEEAEVRVLPYSTLIQSEAFGEILADARERGAFDQPSLPPSRPEDVVQYKRHQEDPNHDAILDAMREYANSLPEHERYAIDTNHRVFNRVYQEFKQAAGDKPLPRRQPVLPQNIPGHHYGDIRDILARKEKAKEMSVVQKPGGGDREGGDRTAARKQYRAELAKVRGGDNEALVNLLAKTVFADRGSVD